MRNTFSELILASQNICIDDQSTTSTGLSDSLTFIKSEINNSVSDMFALLKEYQLEPPPKTLSTIASTTYYPYPSGLMKPESFTIDIGSHTPPLKIVQSQQEWDRLQQIKITSGFPTHVFPRRDDFGIYPRPASVYTVTIVGTYQPVRMTVTDHAVGNVTVVKDSATVTTSSGLFTSDMVDRWFALTDSTSLVPSGRWYRILSVTNATTLELSRTFNEGSVSGQTYVIAQSPEIPEQLHQYIAYKVGASYWQLRRQDAVKAQELLNYFYTGDYNNSKRSGRMVGGVLLTLNDLRGNGRGNSNLIETGGAEYDNSFLANTIWGTTLLNSS